MGFSGGGGKDHTENGTISFSNMDVAEYSFLNPFDIVPRVSLTFIDDSSAPFCEIEASESKIIIRLSAVWTGEIDWVAIGRNDG